MTVNSNYSAYSSNSYSGVSSASQKGKPDFEKMAQELLSSLDTDKSGSIDKAEFSAAAQALASSSSSSTTSSSAATDIFSTLDTDSNGSMSTEELVASLKNMKPPEGKGDMPPPPGGMPPPPPSDSSSTSESSSSSDIIDAMDTNQDGTVSIDELLAALGNSKTDSSNKNNGTASATDSSAASTTSQTENASQKFSDIMLKNILSYYGNNTSTASSTSLLSISA
ncbi:MAG: EF-hand domain-containing protein [Pseudomonadota bacterium]